MVFNSKFKNILLLEKFKEDNLEQFLHKIVDGLCGRSGPSYMDHGTNLNLQEWWDLHESLQAYFKNIVHPDSVQFEELSISENIKQTLEEVLSVRKEEIQQSILESVCGNNSMVLKDFDWKVKLVLTSDQMASIKEPVVSLNLILSDGNSDTQNVLVELNREEFNKFLSSLEGAHKVLTQLKV